MKQLKEFIEETEKTLDESENRAAKIEEMFRIIASINVEIRKLHRDLANIHSSSERMGLSRDMVVNLDDMSRGFSLIGKAARVLNNMKQRIIRDDRKAFRHLYK